MNFEFNDAQINQIVQTLAQRPYAEVFDLMNNIQRQVVQQQQPTGPQLVPPQQTGT